MPIRGPSGRYDPGIEMYLDLGAGIALSAALILSLCCAELNNNKLQAAILHTKLLEAHLVSILDTNF